MAESDCDHKGLAILPDFDPPMGANFALREPCRRAMEQQQGMILHLNRPMKKQPTNGPPLQESGEETAAPEDDELNVMTT
eukprot:scaffold821_cov122-Cylindrotheca_fusiformis.AAC.4